MKQYIIKSGILFLCMLSIISCRDDLLDQPSRTEMPASAFWKTVEDAEYALNGAVSDIRYLFSRDYYLDGMTETVRVRGNVLNTNGPQNTPSEKMRAGFAYVGPYAINPTGYGTQFDNMFEYCYGGINRANYVIDGVENMIERETNDTKKAQLEAILGEAKLWRSLIYWKLISMYGDVPYIDYRVASNDEVSNLSRTPIKEIVPKLVEDLTYAYNKLPQKASMIGRMAKPAALALRGKVWLYWASWNNFGWPELTTFTPDASTAQQAYVEAAKDFRKVIDDFGLKLFRNGDPGECDELGQAEKLPNYYHLFTPAANGDPEFILYFNFGGTGTGQGEELMRDFAGRSVEYSQCWLSPRFEIADKYQSTTTGDYCPPLIPLSSSVPGAQTQENSAINPKSYDNRDYRMKSSIMWDYEKCVGLSARKVIDGTWVPYIYKTWGQPVTIDGVKYTSYETDGTSTGYVFRKFVRNYAGQGRGEGDFNWPVIRLADVYLMYAESVNEANLGGEKAYAIDLVNQVRHRGALPALAASKTGTKEDFFKAIEQERIIELLAEGHRGFDIRRWRAIERVWKPVGDPDGVRLYDTWGVEYAHYFHNQDNRTYERSYIFRIPPKEKDRNPNLTQNQPYL